MSETSFQRKSSPSWPRLSNAGFVRWEINRGLGISELDRHFLGELLTSLDAVKGKGVDLCPKTSSPTPPVTDISLQKKKKIYKLLHAQVSCPP